MNPLPKRAGNEWTRDLKNGEHIMWACANPACKDADGKRTVFDRGTRILGTSEYCPRCDAALKERRGSVLDPEIQAQVDGMESESDSQSRVDDEDGPQARAELYRWKRERINPKLASRWLDLFKE